MANSVLDRLNFKGDLATVINRLARVYQLGPIDSFKTIEVGYEDCNVIVEAGEKRFLAKIFAKFRTPQDIDRYASIIRTLVDNEISHPEIISSPQGDVYKDESGLSLVLLEYVEGKTFLEMYRPPDDIELDQVLAQAAKINGLNIKPPYLLDSWSVQNLEGIYQKIHSYLNPDDLSMIDEVRKRFLSIPTDELPHAFVHGDIIKANTILSKDGEIYIIDLAVSNWYPRIQELAVIGANLLDNPAKPNHPQDVVPKLVKKYRQYGELTNAEVKYLPDYLLGVIAMELLGGSQVKYLLGSYSEETKDWIDLGRRSLHKALED